MKFKLSQMWSHEKGKNYEGDNNNNYGNGNDNAVHSNMFSIKILEPIAKNIILSIHTLTHTRTLEANFSLVPKPKTVRAVVIAKEKIVYAV